MLQFGLTSFVALFFVVDPFAIVPIVLEMTQGASAEQRRATAKKAAVTLCLVLIAFALAGGVIFKVFGASIASFRVAGGALLFLIALDMMRAFPSATRATSAEVAEGADKSEVGSVPLGVPMLAGPGAISTVTVLVQEARGVPWKIAVIGGCIVLTSVLTFWVLLTAERLRSVLQTTGLNVVNRLMGLMLAAVAVQFVAGGLVELFPLLGKAP